MSRASDPRIATAQITDRRAFILQAMLKRHSLCGDGCRTT